MNRFYAAWRAECIRADINADDGIGLEDFIQVDTIPSLTVRNGGSRGGRRRVLTDAQRAQHKKEAARKFREKNRLKARILEAAKVKTLKAV